jgi:hypothetical protein
MIWLRSLGLPRGPFRPLVPLSALAGFQRVMDGQILHSPKPNPDCFITVGADKHTGRVVFSLTSVSLY